MNKGDDKQIALSGMALVTTGIIAKVLGAVYRIPLTNILGAEGIGMYQMVFPIYALMLTLSSSGIPTAISRLVAEKNTLNDNLGARGIVKMSAILLTILGGFFTVIMLILSAPLAKLQGNSYLQIGYYAIAPAVLIVAGSSVFKGYFQGMLNLVPTAITQLVEQIVKMAVGLILASYLMRYGIVYAVAGAILGLTSAELVSFLIMFTLYMRHKTSNSHIHLSSVKHYGEDILRVSLPIAMSGLIFPMMQVIDSMLIVNILRDSGVVASDATALYGLLTGPVNTLINMPIVVTLSLAIMVVPVISSSRITRNSELVKAKCHTSIKLSYIICVPAFFGMFVMAETIMRVLYPSLTASEQMLGAKLLRVSSVSVVLLAEVQIYTSLLEALDKTNVSMKALILSAVVKIIVSIFLIRYLSIVGASIASIIAYLVVVTIDSLYMRRYLGRCDNLFVAVTKIFVSGLIMALAVFLSTYYIQNIYVSLFVGIGVGVAIYATIMILLKVLDRDELLSIPFGRLILCFESKLRFWERNNDKNNRTRNS